MGFISKVLRGLAHWLDTRFPAKVTAEHVYKTLEAFNDMHSSHRVALSGHNERIKLLEASVNRMELKIALLEDEMNKAKTFIGIKSRVVGPSLRIGPNGNQQ